jgi:hypothetical protein
MENTKTVTFTQGAHAGERSPTMSGDRNAGRNSMSEREPDKWVVGMMLKGISFVWKWAGARGALQEVREAGEGWEGWYWRSSVENWSVGKDE